MTEEKDAQKTQEEKRPIPDDAVWKMLQDAYRKVKKDTDPDDVDLYKAFDAKDNGFLVPFVVKDSPGKGRGVFCTDLVSKGTFVNEARCGKFHTEAQWREFLSSIPHDWAKDCVSWAYVDEYNGKAVLWLDFSPAALMNHGPLVSGWKRFCCFRSKHEEEANLDEKLEKGKWHAYATRDILANEELLCDYEDFHDYKEPLSWFEDTWEEYWPHADDDDVY